MTSMRILLVEDDESLGTQVVAGLRSAGYDVEWVTRGDDAMMATFASFSLVILDLMLPGAHGFDVLKALRTDHHHVPVLVLSARHDAADKVRGLELGADDYLTKPFWPEELLARVRARLRRPALAESGHTVEIGSLLIEIDGRVVSVDGSRVDLTRVEFDLVAALARRPGTAVSRRWLAEHVLDPTRDGGERTLDVHISRVRKKLGTAGRLLATVWGIGYRLDDERGPTP